MKTLIKETHMPGHGGGGNGYVVIPESHKLHGVHYDSIDVSVHGGLTFSELVDDVFLKAWPEFVPEDLGSWVVGFDTLHYGDENRGWTKEAVQAEADNLLQQLQET